jgi:hypothetical protein
MKKARIPLASRARNPRTTMTAIAQCGNGELADDCTFPLPVPPSELVEVELGWPKPEFVLAEPLTPLRCESDDAASADDSEAAAAAEDTEAADAEDAAAADDDDIAATIESANVVSNVQRRFRMICQDAEDTGTYELQ